MSTVQSVLLQIGTECHTGTLNLTQSHLVYTWDSNGTEQKHRIPYALLALVTRQPSLQPLTRSAQRRSASPQPSRSPRIYPLQLRLRTFDACSLGFESETQANDVFETLKALAVVSSITQLYAFSEQQRPQSSSSSNNGWAIYDAKAEFLRQGVGSRTKAWRFCDLNVNYDVSPAADLCPVH